MWKLLPVGIGLGLIDCLNPFTISTQIVLSPFVKKRHHIIYYIVGTYLSYLVGGILVYWGIDKLLAQWWRGFMAAHSTLVYSLETLLGAVLIAVAVILFVRHRRKAHSSKAKEAKPPRSVHPVFLFLFGASNTIGDLPTAFPYLIFIARVVDAELSILPVVALMVIYCFIYTLPLFIIYFLYLWSKSKLERLIEAVRKKFAALASWATIILVAGVGVFLIIHGCMNLI